MLLAGLIVISVALTCTMFATRQSMLGFPCAIFWAVMGGQGYLQSTATWDIYYIVFFASMGMTIFSLFAMYGLRGKDLSGPDADEEPFIDEEKEPDISGIDKNNDEASGIDGEKPSKRTKELRERAARRRRKT